MSSPRAARLAILVTVGACAKTPAQAPSVNVIEIAPAADEIAPTAAGSAPRKVAAGAFGPIDCEPSLHTNLEALRKELHADAVAVVEWRYHPDKPNVEVRGTPCPGGGACAAAWKAALVPNPDAAFFVPQDPEMPGRRHYVFAKGSNVIRAGGDEELRAALAPVDGPWKAQVIVSVSGRAGSCGPGGIRASADGYEFFESHTVRNCNPIVTERWRVRVDRSGKVHRLELVEREELPGLCI